MHAHLNLVELLAAQLLLSPEELSVLEQLAGGLSQVAARSMSFRGTRAHQLWSTHLTPLCNRRLFWDLSALAFRTKIWAIGKREKC